MTRYGGLVGSSEPMGEVYGRIDRFADSPVPVLILGETGTGKDLCAHALWEAAGRPGPFVTLNCAAIPETLVDSELFGHRRGAFTGASDDRSGILAQADGGTLFLDEIAELSLATQARLLRALETGTYRPIGGDRDLRSDFRMLAATHTDLGRSVEEHRFREDLLYRLGSARIRMPALRERLDDLPTLVSHFLGMYRNESEGEGPSGLADEALHLLQLATWPGNVRQLRNVIEAAAASADESTVLGPGHLWEFLPVGCLALVSGGEDGLPTLKLAVERAEEHVILDALRHARGNRSEAARMLEISPATFHRKLARMRRAGRFPQLDEDES